MKETDHGTTQCNEVRREARHMEQMRPVASLNAVCGKTSPFDPRQALQSSGSVSNTFLYVNLLKFEM